MAYHAEQTPQDAYVLTGIAAGTVIAIQNKSNTDVMIYAGSSAPADPYEYFLLKPYAWEQFQGDVCMVYAGEKSLLAIQVGDESTEEVFDPSALEEAIQSNTDALVDKEDVGVAAALEAQLRADLQPQISAVIDQTTLNTQNIAAIDTEVDGINSSTTDIVVENTYLSANDVTAGQNINDVGPVSFTSERSDTGWDTVGDVRTYTGTPDSVRISVTVSHNSSNTSASARVAPEIYLYRNNILLASSRTGYIRLGGESIQAHESSSNTISMIDSAPGANPVYTLSSSPGTTNVGVASVLEGTCSFEARKKQTYSLLKVQGT